MKTYKFFILIAIALMAYTSEVSAQKNNEVMLMLKSKDVKADNYKFLLYLETSFDEKTLHFQENPNLQEDMVKVISHTTDLDDSVTVALLNKIKPAKTVDEAFDILKNLNGYETSFLDLSVASKENEESFLRIFGNFFELVRDENGNVEKIDIEKPIPNSHTVAGRIRVRENDGIIEAEGKSDLGNFQRTFFYNSNTGERIPEYSLKYTQSDIASDLGDKIKVIKFELTSINGGQENRTIIIPMELNGCASTEKIRNKMLEVMFGTSEGDILEMANNSLPEWVANHKRGVHMNLIPGKGLVSFGFENQDLRNNSQNTYIVFDKASGNEITPSQLIKDKNGFLKFVNSHNYYLAGYLVDTTRKDDPGYMKKYYGSQFRIYLRHSVNFGPFDGLSGFPISWWFPFSKIDDIIPVEFNTAAERIFLDYNDIRQYIDPKYLETMDEAAQYARNK